MTRDFCRKCERLGARTEASKCTDHCQPCDGTGELGDGGAYGQEYFSCWECGGSGHKNINHRDPFDKFLFRHELKDQKECSLCNGSAKIIRKRVLK